MAFFFRDGQVLARKMHLLGEDEGIITLTRRKTLHQEEAAVAKYIRARKNCPVKSSAKEGALVYRLQILAECDLVTRREALLPKIRTEAESM